MNSGDSPTNPAAPARAQTEVRTVVFTDIVGSTRLKQALGDREGVALIERHHALLREVLGAIPDGSEVNDMGDGFLLLFSRPSEAVRFALLLMARLRGFNAGATHPVRDRVGIHTGEVVLEYEGGRIRHVQGMQIDTAGKLTTLAGADQIVLTRFAFDNARQILRPDDLPGIDELTWLNHGLYAVHGVDDPFELCEVGEKGQTEMRPPTVSGKARRLQAPDENPELCWRPSVGERVTGTEWALVRKLGEGGFGEVWLAEHATLHQHRVFKFCFREDRARSLRREITLFRLLHERLHDHPHIVRVEDVYLEQPPFFLSMEFIEGEDLLRWSEVHGGIAEMPEETKTELVAQIADALSAAHRAGVLHRDVKPSNILIGRGADGSALAKLTDFGIGQVVSQEALAGITGLGFTVTVMPADGISNSGTRLYMAPELVAGQPATPQSDIYSLGLVLYQMLIGDFGRPLTMDWTRRIADPLLREDLELCFTGDPSERYAGAELLAERLRALPERRLAKAQAEADAARRERAAYRRGIYRAASIAAVIVLLLAAAATVAWLNGRRARENNARNEATLDFMLKDLRSKLEPAGRRDVLLTVVDEVLKRQQEINARDDSPGGRAREAYARVLRGDIFLYRVQIAAAEEEYAAAQKALDVLIAREPALDVARRVRASLGYKRGEVQLLLGKFAGGDDLVAQSKSAYEQLLAAGPPDADLKRDAGMAFAKYAGRLHEAESIDRWATEARRLREEAIVARPDQLQWQFELAQSFAQLADLKIESGQFLDAQAHLAESRKLTEALLKVESRSGTWEHHLGQLAMSESAWWAAQPEMKDSLSRALGAAEDAVKRFKDVTFLDAGNAWWQVDLAQAHRRCAELVQLVGESADAAQHEIEAAEGLAKLSKDHPDIVVWQTGASLPADPGSVPGASLKYEQDGKSIRELIAAGRIEEATKSLAALPASAAQRGDLERLLAAKQQDLAEMAERPTKTAGLLASADAAIKARKWDDARTALASLTAIDPNSAAAAERLAVIAAEEAKEMEAVRPTMQKAEQERIAAANATELEQQAKMQREAAAKARADEAAAEAVAEKKRQQHMIAQQEERDRQRRIANAAAQRERETEEADARAEAARKARAAAATPRPKTKPVAVAPPKPDSVPRPQVIIPPSPTMKKPGKSVLTGAPGG